MAKPRGFKDAIKKLKNIENGVLEVKASANTVGKRSIPLPKVSIKASGLKDVLSFFEEFPKASQRAHYKTMNRIVTDLKEALDAAMEADVWEWISDTRDIIDTGALKNSGKVIYSKSDDSVQISYEEEYAAIVHFGGMIRSGYNPEVQILYPARPWITATLEGGSVVPKFEFEKRYLDYFVDFLTAELD